MNEKKKGKRARSFFAGLMKGEKRGQTRTKI